MLEEYKKMTKTAYIPTFILLVLCLLLLFDSSSIRTILFPQVGPTEIGNTYDYRYIGSVGAVRYNVTWIHKTFLPCNVSLVDGGLNILLSKQYFGGFDSIVLEPLQLKNATYYVKFTVTVHFVEGGTETRYIYCLFIYNTKSDDILSILLRVQPEAWDEMPTIGG